MVNEEEKKGSNLRDVKYFMWDLLDYTCPEKLPVPANNETYHRTDNELETCEYLHKCSNLLRVQRAHCHGMHVRLTNTRNDAPTGDSRLCSLSLILRENIKLENTTTITLCELRHHTTGMLSDD